MSFAAPLWTAAGAPQQYDTKHTTHFPPENGPAVVLRLVLPHFGLGDPPHAGVVSPRQVLRLGLQKVPVLQSIYPRSIKGILVKRHSQ